MNFNLTDLSDFINRIDDKDIERVINALAERKKTNNVISGFRDLFQSGHILEVQTADDWVVYFDRIIEVDQDANRYYITLGMFPSNCATNEAVLNVPSNNLVSFSKDKPYFKSSDISINLWGDEYDVTELVACNLSRYSYSEPNEVVLNEPSAKVESISPLNQVSQGEVINTNEDKKDVGKKVICDFFINPINQWLKKDKKNTIMCEIIHKTFSKKDGSSLRSTTRDAFELKNITLDEDSNSIHFHSSRKKSDKQVVMDEFANTKAEWLQNNVFVISNEDDTFIMRFIFRNEIEGIVKSPEVIGFDISGYNNLANKS